MFNKRMLIAFTILCGQITSNQAITNGTQLTLAGASGFASSKLIEKLLSNYNEQLIESTGVDNLSDYHKIIKYSCGLGTTVIVAWLLSKYTPKTKLKKARAISEKINQSPLINIYATNANSYNDAVMRLLVRDDFPLITAFRELEQLDDLINEGITLLNQAIEDAYPSFVKESDLSWEQSSFELLKQKVNDRLCFIKYSQAFSDQQNRLNSYLSGSTNTFFLGTIIK